MEAVGFLLLLFFLCAVYFFSVLATHIPRWVNKRVRRHNLNSDEFIHFSSFLAGLSRDHTKARMLPMTEWQTAETHCHGWYGICMDVRMRKDFK